MNKYMIDAILVMFLMKKIAIYLILSGKVMELLQSHHLLRLIKKLEKCQELTSLEKYGKNQKEKVIRKSPIGCFL